MREQGHQRFAQKKPEFRPLGDIVEDIFTGMSTSGRSVAAKNKGDVRVRVINIGDLDETTGLVDESDLKTVFVDTPRKIQRYLVQPGDVLVACKGTTSKAAVYTGNGNLTVISSNIISIRPGADINPVFLWVYLMSFKGQQAMLARERGTYIRALTVSDITGIKTPFVKKALQDKIAQLVTATNEACRVGMEAIEQRRKVAYGIAARLMGADE